MIPKSRGRNYQSGLSNSLTVKAPTGLSLRELTRPEPGFYIMRLVRGGPPAPALIFQLCPMDLPQPATLNGPSPEEWCRPLDQPPRFAALIDGRPADVERVWATRSLKPVSRAEYEFRIGPLRRW